jgi:predicted nucleic acid-binding protein
MILVDTNVIIEIWKYGNKGLIEKFNNQHIVISGIVKSELLRGARNNKDFDFIIESLSEFDIINPDDEFWNLLGKYLSN